MDLQTMQKQVFRYINYSDTSGDPLTGKDISTTEVTQWLNDRYIEDAFPEFADTKYEYFTKEATAPNYVATGTVDATSTSTTLVATTSIFTSNMVDGYVYNSTDDERAIITSYTSATTVTLDTTIGDTWDGDTIYVFDGLFTFGTGVTDLHKVLWVGVKYHSTDTYYKRCDVTADEDAYRLVRGQKANKRFTQASPYYIFQTETVSSTPTSTVKVIPFDWDEVITDAIYMQYIPVPAALSGATDVPRLPLGAHKFLVFGAVADAYMKIGQFDKAQQFEAKYQEGKKRALDIYFFERKKRVVDFMAPARSFMRRNT